MRPEGPTEAPCPECGGRAGVVSGWVDRDGKPYARYVFDWCESSPARRLVATLSVGDWPEAGGAGDRSAVAIDMREEGWRLLDQPHRTDVEGEFVPDAEVRRRDAVEQVRSIARIVIADDPAAARANAWVGGGRESALGGG